MQQAGAVCLTRQVQIGARIFGFLTEKLPFCLAAILSCYRKVVALLQTQSVSRKPQHISLLVSHVVVGVVLHVVVSLAMHSGAGALGQGNCLGSGSKGVDLRTTVA